MKLLNMLHFCIRNYIAIIFTYKDFFIHTCTKYDYVFAVDTPIVSFYSLITIYLLI